MTDDKTAQHQSTFTPSHDASRLAGSLNYTAALKDFQRVAGSVPSIPRFVLGVWWSRYWPCEYEQCNVGTGTRALPSSHVPLKSTLDTAEDLEEIATGYMTHGLPLDILVSGELNGAQLCHAVPFCIFTHPSPFVASQTPP
jgi:hypothetical protein